MAFCKCSSLVVPGRSECNRISAFLNLGALVLRNFSTPSSIAFLFFFRESPTFVHTTIIFYKHTIRVSRPPPALHTASIAINSDFFRIDSSNAPKEFPSYHELCLSQTVFRSCGLMFGRLPRTFS